MYRVLICSHFLYIGACPLDYLLERENAFRACNPFAHLHFTTKVL